MRSEEGRTRLFTRENFTVKSERALKEIVSTVWPRFYFGSYTTKCNNWDKKLLIVTENVITFDAKCNSKAKCNNLAQNVISKDAWRRSRWLFWSMQALYLNEQCYKLFIRTNK